MNSMIRFLLLLFAFNTPPTLAANDRLLHFKETVCNQCQQWGENTDVVAVGSMRVGKAGPRGHQGPPGPPSVVNMTLIEETMNRKIKESLQMFNAGITCDGAKLESAFARNDSGGVFKLYIPEVGIRNVFCDVTDDGGKWIVLQRRMNGDIDFYRGWDDYVKGFGDLQGDHWLGLEALHQLTKGGNMELKIKMITKDGIYWVAKYSSFHVGPGSDNYRLHVSGYSGNSADDALAHHNNRQFTTKDADHDSHSSLDCASWCEGGWWYNSCAYSNLNGNFNKTGVKGIWWNSSSNQLRFSEMKIRKRT